jgi:hypothetical protein
MLYNQPYGAAANAPFINGDPSIGLAGSIPPAAAIEYPQREIVNLITDAGLATPSNGDLRQLGKAIQSGLLNSKDDAGTANAYAVTLAPVPTAYYAYMRVVMKVLNTNSGASVLNVNALGTKAIKNKDGSALNPGQLVAGALAELIYDGTNFQLVWSEVVTGTGGGVLTANTNLYVNTTTGNDSTLDGTQATITGSKGPFKTVQRAVNEAFKYQPSASYTMTINVADGTYNESVISPSVAGPTIILKGNATTPGNVSIVAPVGAFSAIGVSGPNTWTVRDLKWTCANASQAGVGANGSGANVTTINTESGVCTGAFAFLANGLGAILVAGAHKFTGNCVNAFAAYRNGTINFGSGFTITITTAITVSVFAQGNSGGQIEVPVTSPPTYTNPGNVTGKRYNANLNAVVNSQGAGTSYFPGTVAGDLTLGGQYA